MKFKNEAESMLWALVYAAHINAGKLAGDFGPADGAGELRQSMAALATERLSRHVNLPPKPNLGGGSACGSGARGEMEFEEQKQ